MEEEARVEISLENRFKEALRKAKEVRAYIKERNDTRELDTAEWLAYDMRYVEEYVKQLEEENKSKQKAYDDCYCEYKHYKQFDSIPKSKVKEKIEELDNKRRKFTSDNVNNFYLQEFTRKYTQKSDHDYGVFNTPETITYCINNELLGRVGVLQELLREE